MLVTGAVLLTLTLLAGVARLEEPGIDFSECPNMKRMAGLVARFFLRVFLVVAILFSSYAQF